MDIKSFIYFFIVFLLMKYSIKINFLENIQKYLTSKNCNTLIYTAIILSIFLLIKLSSIGGKKLTEKFNKPK